MHHYLSIRRFSPWLHLSAADSIPRYRTPYTAQIVEIEVLYRQAIERAKIDRF